MKWYRVYGLLVKYAYSMRRNMDRLFDVFYFPAVGLFTWGFTTLYLEDVTQSSQFLRFFLSGFILWTVVQRSQSDLTLALLEDFWSHNIYNTYSSPITNAELFVSTALYAVFRALVAFGFLGLLAVLFYGLNVLSMGVVALALFTLCLILFGSALGVVVAGLIYRFGTRIQVFAWSTAPILQPFSLVFYPRSALPEPFLTVSYVIPTSYIFEGMRTALTTDVLPLGNLAVGYALTAVYLVAGYAFFHHFLEKSRQHGYLAQEM